MGPVSVPILLDTLAKKRVYALEKNTSFTILPGMPEQNVPILPSFRFKNDSGAVKTVKFCSDDLYRNLRAQGTQSRPHAQSDCDCFMSHGCMSPGYPIDELDFHLAISRVFMACRRILLSEVIDRIQDKDQFIQMAAVKLIIEYPEMVDMIEQCASIGGLFRDQRSRRQFVERCVEFYVVYCPKL